MIQNTDGAAPCRASSDGRTELPHHPALVNSVGLIRVIDEISLRTAEVVDIVRRIWTLRSSISREDDTQPDRTDKTSH
jgi:hypothetical protein